MNLVRESGVGPRIYTQPLLDVVVLFWAKYHADKSLTITWLWCIVPLEDSQDVNVGQSPPLQGHQSGYGNKYWIRQGGMTDRDSTSWCDLDV